MHNLTFKDAQVILMIHNLCNITRWSSLCTSPPWKSHRFSADFDESQKLVLGKSGKTRIPIADPPGYATTGFCWLSTHAKLLHAICHIILPQDRYRKLRKFIAQAQDDDTLPRKRGILLKNEDTYRESQRRYRSPVGQLLGALPHNKIH